MIRRIAIIFSTVFGLVASPDIIAAPVTIDTDETRIIVVRPIDLWSGDSSLSEDILESYTSKKVGYFVSVNGEKIIGFPTLFQGVPDHPITKGAERQLAQLEFKLSNSAKHYFVIEKPLHIEASELPSLIQIQQSLFKRMVIDQGDPDTLPGRVKGKKFLGGLLSFGFMAASAGTLGVNAGANFAVSSGISSDLYRLAVQYREGIAPISLSDIDFDGYQNIEIRKVSSNQPDRVGQVIIAYKNGKTPEAEQTALIQAIVTLAGADTTPEAVEQARAEDLAQRKKIWADNEMSDASKPASD